MSEKEKHFYGGQAVLEGVMMRSQDAYATAVRRIDGSVIVGKRDLNTWTQRYRWAKWPLLRGNVALVDSLTMGLESLTFSGNVALEDEAQGRVPPGEQSAAEKQTREIAAADAEKQTLGEKALWLTMIPAMALGVGLFVLLPAWAVDWFMGGDALSLSTNFNEVLVRNLFEGGLRLLAIIGYIAAISLLPYVRRVFEYHGAEHATINAFEETGEVSVRSALDNSPLHPRCGTAFILVVIFMKIIVGCFLGWPELWLRLLLRLAILAPVAGVAYEIIRYAGRHRGGGLEKVLAGPGLLMQKLTTRQADEEQVEIAIYALAAVAPEVDMPEGFEEPERVKIGRAGEIVREPDDGDDGEAAAIEATPETGAAAGS
ncbi:MAG: DUF1385 domain-containing protein [Armatimonadota bacterium]|jgi:uncharacterized protein YqhQ